MHSHESLISSLPIVVALGGLLFGGHSATLAQDATPAAETAAIVLPLAPDPALCIAEESPLAELQAIHAEVQDPVGAAMAEPADAAFVEPEGEPADAATAMAITEVVVAVIRCNANGGSGLADAFYLTEEHLRENLANMSDEDFALYTAKTPLPPEAWLMVYAVRDARVLPDGRVAANPEIIVPGIGHFRDTLIFEQVDGRWLIDESHEGEPIFLSE